MYTPRESVSIPQARRAQNVALGKLFHGLGNFIQGVRQLLDILAFEGRDEGAHQQIANLGGQLLLMPARGDELIQGGRNGGVEENAFERGDAILRLLRTFFEQREERIIFAEKLL